MKRLLAGLMVILMLRQYLPGISFAASAEELPAKETLTDAFPAEENITETAPAEEWHELVSDPVDKPVYHSVTFTVDGEAVTTIFAADGTEITSLPQALEIDGEEFVGWYDGDQPFTTETEIYEDKSILGVYREKEDVEGALYANEDLYITGKVPGNGFIDVIPVQVEVDGEETLAAYDISIYVNKKQQEKGKTWQPAEKKVQVHWRNDAFEGELNVYHLDGEQPEHVDTVEAENGWVTFEAQSFSAYAVTRTILNETVTTSDGMTYEIQVTYHNTSGIPMQGTELAVSEILPDDAAFTAYLEESARTIGIKPQNIEFARAFDISIVDEKDPALVYEPAGDVDVSIRLIGNSLDEYENVDVLHFAKPKRTLLKASASKSFTVEEMDSAVSGETVQFTTGSFSVYMVAGYVIEKEIVASDGQTYRITVEYGEDAGIPGDAELKVEEVSEEKYAAYLTEAAAALGADIHHISFSRLFDISIVKDEVEYQPNDAVRVTVELLDTENVDDVQVVHFEDEETPVQLTASTEGTTVAFETESFSVFSFLDFSLLDRVVSAVLGEKTGTLYENDDIVLTGRMPSTGIVVAEPVEVSIDSREALVAYDIKIYAGPIMKLLGICWQPSGDAIHVTLKSDALNVENVDVYHMEDVAGEADLVTESIPVEEHTVTFDADKFSVYVIMSTILTKTINTSDGSTYEIVVTYKETAGIPMEGTELVVSEVLPEDAGYEQYIGASALKLGAKTENVAFARAFDIKIVDANDPAVVYEPSGDVEVSIRLLGTSLADYANVGVLHFIPGEDFSLETFDAETFSVDEMETVVSEETVEFTTDSFSVYVIAGYTLETIIEAGDGNSYRITVTFTEDALLPEDAALTVVELDGDLFADYIGRTASALDAGGFEYARVFDISIVDGEGQEIQPSVPVDVKVELLDAESGENAFSVVHFLRETEELEIAEQIEAETEDNAVSFVAESFSAYAIVRGPEDIPLGWHKVTSFEDLISMGNEGVYIGHPDGYYYQNTLAPSNDGRTGIKKTDKPAQSYPKNGSSLYYFEMVPETENQIYAYCYAPDGVTKQYVYNGGNNSLSFTSAENKTAFTVTKNSDGTFKLNNGSWYWNMQGGANGTRFCSYNNANDANNKVNFWYYTQNDSDPYGLNGKTYGLMSWDGGVTGRAMMASSERENALDAKPLTVMSTSNNSSQMFVPNDSDISMWTFEWIREDRYYLKAVVNGSTQYLSIAANGLSLVSVPDDSCELKVKPGTGTNAGQICLKAGNTTLTYSGSVETGFSVGGSAGSEWLNLVELSELTSAYFRTYTASKVSVSDPSISNGSHVIVYTRIWDDEKDKYIFYVVDGEGNLKPCYEYGDTIQWVGGLINTMLWDFVEYYWEGTTDPNYYYELYNQYSGQFIAPQVTGGQILSGDTIGINLNGRRNGKYYSSIVAWDDDYYAYAGLKVDPQTNKIVSCPLAEADDFYFAIVDDLPLDDNLNEVPTVDHTQYGITMRIKDVSGKDAATNDLNTFLGSSDGGTGTSLQQGLLSSKLNGNYPSNRSGESLETVFNGAEKVNHLFIASTYNGSGYFEYDSSQNFASLKGRDGGDFTVYKQIGTYDISSRPTLKHGQFFPFNDIRPGVFAVVNGRNTNSVTGSVLPDSDPRKYERLYNLEHGSDKVNCFFALEIEASFTQTANGLDNWGHDIIYEFTGDDDFWLYVDGELVIDLGGIHSAVPGSVNYRTGVVNVNGTNTTLRALFENNYRGRNPGATDQEVANFLAQYFEEGSTVFKDYTTHTMRIFYMERGAGASNLHMRFNLASVRPGHVLLSKELDGVSDSSSVMAEFPYQIWYKLKGEGEREHLLTQGDALNVTVQYKDTIKPVKYKNSLVVDGITYNSVFLLKPGEVADITVPEDSISYRIVECGVNKNVFRDVTVKEDTVSEETRTDSRSDYELEYAETSARPRVTYVNTVESFEKLTITKKLYKEDGSTQITDDPTEFSFRLYLTTEFGDNLDDSPADMFAYYVKNEQGQYCRWDSSLKQFVSLGVPDFSNLTGEQLNQATFHTSMNGSISRIPGSYQVEFHNLLAGTQFKVEERPGEIPDGYSFQKYVLNTVNSNNTAEAGVSGVIEADSDAAVDICNLRGWGLRVNKVWSDESYMDNRAPTYFAVYWKNGDTEIIVPEDVEVKDEDGIDTTIVRQLKYGKSSVYWYFKQLPVSDTNLSSYVIREVELEGATIDVDGNLTGYTAVRPVSDRGEITFTGWQKGESAYGEFSYIVTYTQGTVPEDSQVRVDTVYNKRPGILLKKTDWAGNPLPGAKFELKDSQDSLIGTFTSGEDGSITTAFLSNDGAQYTLTETESPSGYQGLPESMHISQSNDTVTVTGVDPMYYTLKQGSNIETSLTIKNRPYTLQAVKVDEDTRQGLRNVVFALHRQVTVGGVTTFDINPMPGYENLKTDANGVIPKIDNTLSAGTYQLREKSTLSGYELLSTNIEFTVSPTGEISLSEEAPGEATLSFDINSDDMCVYTLTVENSAGAMLTIEKQVTGDFGDKTIAFPFKVTVPGTNNGDTVDVYVNGVKDPSKALTVANEQVSFSLQHGGSITLKLPKNKLITVTEENGVYMASWQLGGAASSTPGNSAELTLTGNATLTFTNLLNAVAPTGYRTETLPYLLLMLAGILLLVLNRKRVFAGKRR